MTVIRAESTDAVLPFVPAPVVIFADSAAPNVVASMSDAVHESFHRSVEPPYDAKVSDVGQAVPLDLSAASGPIAPPLTMRTALSLTVPPVVLRSHST